MTLKGELSKHIADALGEEVVLGVPKSISFGHYYSSLGFLLSKKLRQPPSKIADDICDKLQNTPSLKSVRNKGGYINFTVSDELLDKCSTWSLKNKNDFARLNEKGKILLEYISANPTGPLHIGHARGAYIGDCLQRIGKHLGYKIDSEYYVNDIGNQIKLFGASIYYSAQRNILKLNNIDNVEVLYRGDYIDKFARDAHIVFGDSIFNKSNKEKNIQTLSKWGVENMLKSIKYEIKDIDVNINNFIFESDIYTKEWGNVKKILEENGGLYKKDNKIYLKSSSFKDEKDRVIIKDTKEPTYLAGDISYHYLKFKREYDLYINIWGADHHGYIDRLKAAIRYLGFNDNKLEILISQIVSILKDNKPYKMSKRKGNFILLRDVIKEIGKDEARVVFLSKKSDSSLVFDVNLFKKKDKTNPFYYINYAHARINQIFNKSSFSYLEVLNAKLENLSFDASNILFASLRLPDVLQDAFNSRDIHKIINYLQTLSSLLHKFYHSTKIVDSKDELVNLKVILTASLSIRTALRLIGVRARDKM